jgi:hypothetical protein
MAIDWPDGVPDRPWEPGYVLEIPDLVLRGQVDVGPEPQRVLLSGKPWRGQAMIVMTPAELAAFLTWWAATGQGERVNWVEPLTEVAGELRVVGGQSPFRITPWKRLYRQVAFEFEFFP